MLESFTCSTFLPHLGSTFRLHGDEGQSVDLVLVEANELPRSSADGGRDPFSIVFRGQPGSVLPQRIYRLEHTDVGAFDLFLVPIGMDADGLRYEAVFT